MSHKILLGAGVLAVLVIGVAWFAMSSSATQTSTYTDQTQATTATSSTTNTDTTGTSGTGNATSYTLAQVATHKNASSCWAAISGKVYDLTAWINQHPGGPDKILGICGTDATAAFTAQHAGQPRPANELTNFYIGTLE